MFDSSTDSAVCCHSIRTYLYPCLRTSNYLHSLYVEVKGSSWLIMYCDSGYSSRRSNHWLSHRTGKCTDREQQSDQECQIVHKGNYTRGLNQPAMGGDSHNDQAATAKRTRQETLAKEIEETGCGRGRTEGKEKKLNMRTCGPTSPPRSETATLDSMRYYDSPVKLRPDNIEHDMSDIECEIYE